MATNPQILAAGLVIALLLRFLYDVGRPLRHAFTVTARYPGRYIIWTNPMGAIALVTASFFPPRGWLGHNKGKFALYAKAGSTCLSAVRIKNAQPYFWFADAEAIKQIVAARHIFTKDVASYEVLSFYGDNLVATEGADWKRHSAVAYPAFGDANNVLVWSETTRIMHEWFDVLDSNAAIKTARGMEVNVRETMIHATLLVISAAGFGKRTPWSQMHTVADDDAGNDLPFHDAVSGAIDKLIVKVLAPEFLFTLPVRIPYLSAELDSVRRVFDSLRDHMLELVRSVRNGSAEWQRSEKDLGRGQGADLLRRLVEANGNSAEPGEKRSLTDNELLSNIFTFLLAGHETSAHTLSFALVLLALYPDVQRKVREEVTRVWPDIETIRLSSTYKEDFQRLEYTFAVFRETLRCFPVETRLHKLVQADSVLPATRFSHPMSAPISSYDGDLHNIVFPAVEQAEVTRFSIHVPAGSVVIMDVMATHMNPFLWGADAHIFRPERFIDTETYRWPRDAFLPFSAGARSCIGQRFANTSSVCLLANLVRRFEILLPSDDLNGSLWGRDAEVLKRRMLDWTTGVTMTPTNARVNLRRLVG